MASKLLQNGTILSFDDSTQSIKVLRNASVLIKNDEIAAIGKDVEVPENAEVIDISGRICSPGFINTHSHIWQTAYRTMLPNTTLAEYFVVASQFSSAIKLFSPKDIYISCMAGYYEALNAGVTSFVEHAHNNWKLDAVREGWDAAVTGGARVWWCLSIEDREACKAKEQAAFMETLGLRDHHNHSLVALGLSWDGFGSASTENIEDMKGTINKLNLEAITVHYLGNDGPWPVPDTSPTAFAKANIQELGIPVVFSHAGLTTENDRDVLRKQDWNISITPESEMHFGQGQISSRYAQDQASLGIDTNWTFSGDILTQARLWLQHVRVESYNDTLKSGFIPKNSSMSVEDAFLLATRQGGRAVRRDDIGVLKVGAKADIVVFNGESPNMAGWTDPVAAVVLHANVGDIEHVLVGGEFRKRDRKLVMKEGNWDEFQKKFAEVARRIQGQSTDRPDLGEMFWGAAPYGDVEVLSTRRSTT